jgi:low affinity Fe/Cu permease
MVVVELVVNLVVELVVELVAVLVVDLVDLVDLVEEENYWQLVVMTATAVIVTQRESYCSYCHR